MAEISVVIPTLNAGPLLAETIRSVLAQSVECEVIVVRSASDVQAPEYLCEPEFSGVQILQCDRDRPGACRDLGMRTASCQWVHFQDADDLVYPDALSQLLCLAMDHDLLVIGGLTIGVPGTTALSDLQRHEPSGGVKPVRWRHVVQDIVTGSMRAPGAMSSLYHSSVLSDIEWPADLRVCEDYLFQIHVASRATVSRMGFLPRPVRAYRLHPLQTTRQMSTEDFVDGWKDFTARAMSVPQLQPYRGWLQAHQRWLDSTLQFDRGQPRAMLKPLAGALRLHPQVVLDKRWLTSLSYALFRSIVPAKLTADPSGTPEPPESEAHRDPSLG